MLCSAKLKQFMRCLLTRYAISFNKRHHWAGHVFQNRCKSIVFEEETYLLELVRYIYLNPLRAKIMADIGSLNKYQQCRSSCHIPCQSILHRVCATIAVKVTEGLISRLLSMDRTASPGSFASSSQLSPRLENCSWNTV